MPVVLASSLVSVPFHNSQLDDKVSDPLQLELILNTILSFLSTPNESQKKYEQFQTHLDGLSGR